MSKRELGKKGDDNEEATMHGMYKPIESFLNTSVLATLEVEKIEWELRVRKLGKKGDNDEEVALHRIFKPRG